jgi:hypothetical protein
VTSRGGPRMCISLPPPLSLSRSLSLSVHMYLYCIERHAFAAHICLTHVVSSVGARRWSPQAYLYCCRLFCSFASMIARRRAGGDRGSDLQIVIRSMGGTELLTAHAAPSTRAAELRGHSKHPNSSIKFYRIRTHKLDAYRLDV